MATLKDWAIQAALEMGKDRLGVFRAAERSHMEILDKLEVPNEMGARFKDATIKAIQTGDYSGGQPIITEAVELNIKRLLDENDPGGDRP